MGQTKKIVIRADLVEQAKTAAEKAGYSTVEEFIEHAIEQALHRFKLDRPDAAAADDADDIARRMKGLGYM